MNKEIIIDGVDVSQCPKYATNEEFNLEKAKGKDLCLNCAGVECFYKKYELLKIQNQQQYMEFKNKEINYEEQIRQLRLLKKELRDCLKNDLTKLQQNQAVLNEIEKHLKNYLNMQNPAVNELNDGFNTGMKTAATLVLNIIENYKAQEAQKVINARKQEKKIIRKGIFKMKKYELNVVLKIPFECLDLTEEKAIEFFNKRYKINEEYIEEIYLSWEKINV